MLNRLHWTQAIRPEEKKTPCNSTLTRFFEGPCEEAIEFYRAKLGAGVTRLARFKDASEPHSPA